MASLRVAMCMAVAASAWAGTARDELVALRADLAKKRQLGRSPSWPALLRFAKAHAKEPALAAQVLYDVALEQRRQSSGSPYAARTLAQLLKSYPKAQPWAALATYELADLYGGRASTRQKAAKLYEQFLAFKGADAARRAKATYALAELYEGASMPDEALARYRAFAKEFPHFGTLRAKALHKRGKILLGRKQLDEARQVYEQLSKDHPSDVESRSGLLRDIIVALRTAEKHEAAIAAAERYLKEFPSRGWYKSQVYIGLATVHAQQRNTKAAAEVYRRMAADKTLRATERAQALRYLFAFCRRADDHETIIRRAYELIAAAPTASAASGGVLSHLVEALISTDRLDEALAMARADYQVLQLVVQRAGSSSTHDPILSVIRALKAKEGGLRSANAFLKFSTSGPAGPDGRDGTADDLKDPLAGVRLPPEKTRDGLFAAAARRFADQPLELGYLHLCWDKPAEALRAFRQHYLGATSRTKLQAAASVLAQAMRAVGRPESEVGAFFDFQNYGPNGRDARPNTADDLKDPILGLK